ncbi:sulfotransferase [Gallaecimonas mangrovi]|uniref:sulfotransferase n=1 Tax=Gallaecimonas mangrovi TaxID=2291597 RepID=UPI000E202E7B|nr:sulfotransferase [Gallaecimonas mangrovi]
MNKIRRPILVTGSHRSGTTWAGRNLALAPNTGYIHEPFNLDHTVNSIDKQYKYWFFHVSNDSGFEYKKTMDKVIEFKYPFFANLPRIHTSRNVARFFIDHSRSLYHRLRGDTPIVKDPIAFFSAEWLSSTYNMNVLVMIRHPAAFCSSLKIKNWTFDFRHFFEQEELMNGFLFEFKDEIRECINEEKDIIDQAILLWNCIHKTISSYKKEHADWVFVRHEDLSQDPIEGFKSIFDSFGLDFNDDVKEAIYKNSGSHNPTEQQSKNEFVRNSKENIHNWKKRLTEDEIKKIKEKTSSISNEFYHEDDW